MQDLLGLRSYGNGNAFELLTLKLLSGVVVNDRSVNLQLLAAVGKELGFVCCESK
jgi:hypothetical protein